MRNPKWHRDEIILALDLYFSHHRGPIDKSNAKIIELSKTLNQLPLFPNRPDAEKFRNPNGVTLKLSNFLAFDPAYHGKGMEGGSRLDEIIFKEFFNDRERLHTIAKQIKLVSSNEKLKQKIYQIEEDDHTLKDEVSEGQVLYKLHKVRERDSKIVTQKKAHAMLTKGQLACEACIFDFFDFYGELGYGYIECHHRIPLRSLEAERKTRLDDLALVCSNCHRMLHKSSHILTLDELKIHLKYQS
jgi:5-methylcytosine-specific restriction enzyme A